LLILRGSILSGLINPASVSGLELGTEFALKLTDHVLNRLEAGADASSTKNPIRMRGIA